MWLLKTEPSSYGYADLVREGRTRWDGVRNPVALANMRRMKPRDAVVVYHTGTERSSVGLARVVSDAYEVPAGSGAWGIDIEPAGAIDPPVGLADIKKLELFADSPLVRQGRLSVVPLTKEQFAALGGTRARR